VANLPVPIPRTATVSEVETGADLNTLRDAVTFLLNPPDAVLYQATAQSVANGAFAPATLDASTVDTYGGHSNVTNNSRYTAQVAGTALVSAVGGFAANGTGARGVAVYKNGSAVEGKTQAVVPAVSTVVTLVPLTCQVPVVAGDYLEVFVYQSSGGALNTSASLGQRCGMDVLWIHA
jgi:hypothetical protein